MPVIISDGQDDYLNGSIIMYQVVAPDSYFAVKKMVSDGEWYEFGVAKPKRSNVT